jgi:integrase
MRIPQPYWRKQARTWYVQLGKKQIRLGRNKKEAFEKYHEIMADRGTAAVHYEKIVPLLDDYLEWVKQNREPLTFEKAVRHLQPFAEFIGPSLTISGLTPHLVLNWAEKKKTWNSTTKNDAISMVQRALNWGVKRGHIPRSPIAKIDGKPRRLRREVFLTEDEFKQLRVEVTDCFADILDFMWFTGCRPTEARNLKVEHVDLKNKMVMFPCSESKGKRNERVIFLPPQAACVLERQLETYESGFVFRNTHGNKWRRNALSCRFKRLREKIGKQLCAYAMRHSYATEGLKRGVDSLTLAQIMGHSDTTMLSRHYAHLARNPVYLAEQACRVRG